MVLISEGANGSLREYVAAVAGSQYPLTHQGDTPLRPLFAEALIRAATIDNKHEDREQDAREKAEYILSLPTTLLTQNSQIEVSAALEMFRLPESDLIQHGLCKCTAISVLEQANADYFEAQRMEWRAIIALGCTASY
jgi:hypothetical protein